MQNVNSFTEMFRNNDFTNNSIANSWDDNIRTTDGRLDTLEDTERNSKKSSEIGKPESDININIFRYKFDDDFSRELFVFSKIHQYDPRKEFKEAWKIWLEENECIVDEEVRRLKNLGYDGDVLDKMFKSARYYFRKKPNQKKDTIERKEYICLNKQFLETIDEHVKSNMNKPSEGLVDFCKNNIEILKEEIEELQQNGITDMNEIKNKIKKTYKNRYFLIMKNNKETRIK